MTQLHATVDCAGMPGMSFNARAYFRSMITGRSFSAYGVIAQLQFAGLLVRDGFEVAVEVQAPYQHRNGRIDLAAWRDDVVIGIEIDSWRTPKSKSIEKLATFEDLTHRVIFLNHDRNLFGKYVPVPVAVRDLAKRIDYMAHLDVVFCPGLEKDELVRDAWRQLKTYSRRLEPRGVRSVV